MYKQQMQGETEHQGGDAELIAKRNPAQVYCAGSTAKDDYSEVVVFLPISDLMPQKIRR